MALDRGNDGELSDESDGGPQRPTGCLARLAQSSIFQGVVIGMIALNTMVMAWEADNPDHFLAPYFDNIFLVFFVCELSIRLSVERCSFFYNADRCWNNFDFFIVMAGVFDQWVVPLVFGDTRKMSKIMMIVRIFRILRVLRAIRLFKQFKELYQLAKGLIESTQSVGWIGILFLLLILVSAIFVTKVVGHNTELWEGEDVQVIQEKFGTILRSMNTLFIFLTFDDWSTPARMVNKKMPIMELFWIFYIVMGAFTLLSLLTGLMADKMNQVRSEEEEHLKGHKSHLLNGLIDKLKAIFDKADTSGDAMLDLDEFATMLATPDLQAQMADCGLQLRPEETQEVFTALDRTGRGQIPWPAFRDGLLQLCKEVSSKDIMWLEGAVSKLDRSLRGSAVGGPGQAWDQKLDRVYARASLVRERVLVLERDLLEFFQHTGYHL